MAGSDDVSEDDYILNRDWRAVASIWAIDVVRDLDFPVTVDAIDISMAQCPPKSWLPDNIRLMTHDVHQPFPSSLLGTYDFVNVQNWLCIWREEKSDTLIRNLLGLLKPGGFIQWSEQNPDANRIVTAPGVSTSTDATEEVLSFLGSPRKTISFDEDTERATKLRSAADRAAVEMLNGVGIYSELVVAIAQKEFAHERSSEKI
ncbi:MAG: hypothetical protein Q9194_002893 [Teloschistes cf. exilis]